MQIAAAQKERKMYSVVWKGLFAVALMGAAHSAFANVITDWNETAAAMSLGQWPSITLGYTWVRG
jgi:hypothetical protein